MGRYLKLTTVALSLLLAVTVQAQNCVDTYLGTKTLYVAPKYKAIPAPAGYQPVFINYVGRHGARHLTKEVTTSFAFKLLEQADSSKGLTATGMRLKEMVGSLNSIERGNVKSISGEGEQELKGIAARMYSHYPQVFTNTPKLNVAITKELRTKQSAAAFLAGLKANFKDSAQVKQYTDDTSLRFYDISPTYTSFEEGGSWLGSMAQLKQKLGLNALNKQIIGRWLTPAFIKSLNPLATDNLVNDVFGFATIEPSLKIEAEKAGVKPMNFASLFTCTELAALSKVDIAEDYLKKGPGADNSGIQVRIAMPLLVNFINTADNFKKNKPVNAELRFAHAETISPFATLTGIAVASGKIADLAKANAEWQSSRVIPLSANIQWIFYGKKGTDKLLVKILLNEKEVHINRLVTNTFPFYKWEEMRAFYMHKLATLNVQLADDMNKYLEDVK